MNKTNRITTAVLILLGLIILNGCGGTRQKSGPELSDREWILTQIIYPNNDTIIAFPGEMKSITLSFKKNGPLNIGGLCNYSYASFSTKDSLLSVTDIGPGTKMLCDPDQLMLWEIKMVSGLKTARYYSLKDDLLRITCDGESVMIFRFDSKKPLQ